MKRILLLSLLIVTLPTMVLAAGGSSIPLFPFKANVHDLASLQRGARLYMNYCAGCHSLQYMRYTQLASGIGMVNDHGDVLADVLKENLIFDGAKIHDSIKTAMPAAESNRWFGVQPPDLTLEVRVRGARWLYTYLRTFYQDPNRPWGANNLVYPDVGMPNVLLPLQGVQLPIYRTITRHIKGEDKQVKVFDHLKSLNNGSMSSQQFDQAVTDLVNFLAYVSEPMKRQQHYIGTWVLVFLVVFAIICYLLKREYWKDIH